jgi:hypothetical protein
MKMADRPALASLSATSTRASAPSSKSNDASTNKAVLPFASLLHWLHPFTHFSYIEGFFFQHTGRHRQHLGMADILPLEEARSAHAEGVHNDFCRGRPGIGFQALSREQWEFNLAYAFLCAEGHLFLCVLF